MFKVFVNGTFDLLHIGHIELLKYAKSHDNSCVYVAIDSDERVKSLKGDNRPINTEEERKYYLKSLKFVDDVIVFNTDQELKNIIKMYSPDIMIKGSDYKGKEIIGAEYCKEIKFYERIQQYSTSKSIQYIVNRR
jgi:D-beta-D-heptose 7-phosphate kinase/D-beta-D-heptose 1-phosphate adenosyltransferase